MKKLTKIIALAFLALALTTASAFAMPILDGSYSGGLWSASDSDGRSATAQVFVDSGYLNIILTNTSIDPTVQPNEILMGVFFDFSGTLMGTPNVSLYDDSYIKNINTSATYTTSMMVGGNTYSTSRVLNGEFGYLTGLGSENGDSGSFGVGSSSLDPLGFQSIESSLFLPNAPNGSGFGILSIGQTLGFSNNKDPYYIIDSVLIQWEIGTTGTVSNLDFIYGTSYEQVPEPATLVLLGAGLVGLGFSRKRMK